MIAHSEWKHDEVFEGRAENGNTIVLDADPAHAHGPSPMEVVLMALCGCTSVDVVGVLEKKRQELAGLRVTATATQAESAPRVFTRIMLTYAVRGQAEPQGRGGRSGALQKQVLLRIEDAGEGGGGGVRDRLSRRRAGAMSGALRSSISSRWRRW